MNQPATNQFFSQNLKRALRSAHGCARELGQSVVTPEHLLFGLIVTRGSVSSELLHKQGVRPLQTQRLIAELFSATTGDTPPELTGPAQRVLQQMAIIAQRHQHRYIGTEHLLAALLENPPKLVLAILAQSSVNLETLTDQLTVILRSTSKLNDIGGILQQQSESSPPGDEGMPFGQPPQPANSGNVLELFTVDLTDPDVQSDIDPVIGRQTEIERLTQILCRRTKNNPVLLGEPGVGKTAIVEGLAKNIVNARVPEVLLDKQILMLDLGLLLAGTMYRGEFEQRLKNVITEIQKDDSVILFIDELHTLTGAGAAPGSMDAANILKPSLARGQIRCIGATTLDEYRKHIEADPALERRFQPVMVAEPTVEKTVAILTGVKPHYESYHHVTITDEAIKAAAQLSHRYVTERFLPDKAIDLIDEAAAKVRVAHKPSHVMQKARSIEQGIAVLEKNKRQAIADEKFDQALSYKHQQAKAQQELHHLRSAIEKEQQQRIGRITAENIAQLVSDMTGIPLAEVAEDQQQKILDLEKSLKKAIVGQDEAIEQLVRAIKRSRAGVATEQRPIGSFIFLGPSGVGKTALAKVLAKELFEDESALVKIDMSEFRESFNVSKLIGSPPGYVGYRESGQLTEAVRRRPYSVVLFDEIEKAHPEIFNILLQVMEDGMLTDATGRQVNFKNTIIIMTSNVGLQQFVRTKSIGFDAVATNDDLYDEMKGYLEKSLVDQFRPEFLNRLDATLFFRPLNAADLKKIVRLQLAELNSRLGKQGVTIKADAKAVNWLATHQQAPQQGARLIRRHIQTLIETPLSELILQQKTTKRGIISVTVSDNNLQLTPQ